MAHNLLCWLGNLGRISLRLWLPPKKPVPFPCLQPFDQDPVLPASEPKDFWTQHMFWHRCFSEFRSIVLEVIWALPSQWKLQARSAQQGAGQNHLPSIGEDSVLIHFSLTLAWGISILRGIGEILSKSLRYEDDVNWIQIHPMLQWK